jgi:hypothetical protein
MGTDRETPRIARNSAYREWWTAANGALPDHGEAMTPDVFMQDQVYRIKVADALIDRKKQAKSSAEIYSKVVGLVDVTLTGNGTKRQSPIRNQPSGTSTISHQPSGDAASALILNLNHASPHQPSTHQGGNGNDNLQKSQASVEKKPISSVACAGRGNAHTPKRNPKGGGFGLRSGKTVPTIQ